MFADLGDASAPRPPRSASSGDRRDEGGVPVGGVAGVDTDLGQDCRKSPSASEGAVDAVAACRRLPRGGGVASPSPRCCKPALAGTPEQDEVLSTSVPFRNNWWSRSTIHACSCKSAKPQLACPRRPACNPGALGDASAALLRCRGDAGSGCAERRGGGSTGAGRGGPGGRGEAAPPRSGRAAKPPLRRRSNHIP